MQRQARECAVARSRGSLALVLCACHLETRLARTHARDALPRQNRRLEASGAARGPWKHAPCGPPGRLAQPATGRA